MNLRQINALTKVAYDKTAQKYHDHFKDEMIQKAYDRLILDRFSDMVPMNALVCDAGCGPSGHIGEYLANKGHKVVGIDLSPQCIEIATSYSQRQDFKVMDMTHTDFGNSSLDAVVAFYSIIYTPKEYVADIFAEFKRILKSNGRLLVVVKKGSDKGIVDDPWYEGHKVYFTHFMEDEIKRYFSEHNFSVDFLETRQPYDFELPVDRICAIGTKKTG